MSALRLLALILLCTILLGACGRSELIRIRMLAPVNEDKKDHSILTETTESSTPIYTNTSSGGSLYFLLKSIGLGYTTVTTNFEKIGTNLKETTTLKTNFADVAFGIGENYSFMWGAGILTGGEQKRFFDYNDKGTNQQGNKPLSMDNYLGGHSLFFVLGHHGFGFETLLGYRMNFIKLRLDDSEGEIHSHMGKSPTDTGEVVSYESPDIRLTTAQVQLGIGFTF
ncbi:MAG: hypothetical protein DSY96_03280 [SAR324 cluster bacterium]|uniref:Outer membrane protein beta-barrel domain-containing protein n=1 Tax=SAR324 cluster bacterium TaxID=2024889 RepID=A0A432GRQ0_9DELT|nr:MAG: hypothetical protein DSY96_03280 [SAR324 cluster bacterium]